MSPGNGAAPGRATEGEQQADIHHNVYSHPTALHRRFLAASRGVLECGCADPWLCRCLDEPRSLTNHRLDAIRDAAQHLLGVGICPVVSPEAARILWRRGGDDRRLLSEIASRNGFPSDHNPLPDRTGGA